MFINDDSSTKPKPKVTTNNGTLTNSHPPLPPRLPPTPPPTPNIFETIFGTPRPTPPPPPTRPTPMFGVPVDIITPPPPRPTPTPTPTVVVNDVLDGSSGGYDGSVYNGDAECPQGYTKSVNKYGKIECFPPSTPTPDGQVGGLGVEGSDCLNYGDNDEGMPSVGIVLNGHCVPKKYPPVVTTDGVDVANQPPPPTTTTPITNNLKPLLIGVAVIVGAVVLMKIFKN